jgi:hypothetical protein
MPARLYHNQRFIASNIAATSAAASYPAIHMRLLSTERAWRSTSNALQNIDIDLNSSVPVTGVCVQGTNAPSFTVFGDAAITPATTNRGTITPVADGNGRRKGSINLGGLSLRYLRLQIPAAGVVADDDGTVQSYYTIGAVYVFGSTLNLPRDPIYGQSSIQHVTPQTSVNLANGQNVTSNDGAPYSNIAVGFGVRADQDIERARRMARLGACWLDLDIASERWRQWPVRSVTEQADRRLTRINGEQVDLQFRELA